jgi:hypothetical protein
MDRDDDIMAASWSAKTIATIADVDARAGLESRFVWSSKISPRDSYRLRLDVSSSLDTVQPRPQSFPFRRLSTKTSWGADEEASGCAQ